MNELEPFHIFPSDIGAVGWGIDIATGRAMGTGGDSAAEAGKIGPFDAGREFEASAEFAIARAVDGDVDRYAYGFAAGGEDALDKFFGETPVRLNVELKPERTMRGLFDGLVGDR
jgi:hypothetical protein